MVTRDEIENVRSLDDICLLARRLGYRGIVDQLLLSNGSAVSDLLAMIDDNPGMITAMVDWILEDPMDADGNRITDDEEED